MRQGGGVTCITAIAIVLASASCRPRRSDRSQFRWDDRRVLCSLGFDDSPNAVDWRRIRKQLGRALQLRSVLMLHAHDPGVSVSLETVERLLDLVDEYPFDYVTFDELSPSSDPHPAVAIAFDDAAVEHWYGLRELLARHHARVSFFVTQVAAMSPRELAMLRVLAADGHAIEAHSARHLHARDYVRERGVAAYVTDEVIPSIVQLRALGFAPTSYAYPYGENVGAVDRALLAAHVQRLRVGRRSCPY